MLRETMSDFGMAAVDDWWSGLNDSARDEVIELWRTTSFGQPCVARVEAHFVEDGEPGAAPLLWHDDFYEYLVNHEVYLPDAPPVHICTQQPAAKAAVTSGFISSGFVCPLAHDACPMRQLLRFGHGKSVRLNLTFIPDSSATGGA